MHNYKERNTTNAEKWKIDIPNSSKDKTEEKDNLYNTPENKNHSINVEQFLQTFFGFNTQQVFTTEKERNIINIAYAGFTNI